MSYGVALRNGVPFTLGTIAALCVNATGSAWSPLALWPDGIATPGMWISPRTLTSEWQGSAGTTPVSVPGTVADASNPVGLALDIRAGTPVLGPELVVNGDFSDGGANWQVQSTWTFSGGFAVATATYGLLYQNFTIPPSPAVNEIFSITYTISDYVSGTIVPGMTYGNGTARSGNGTYTDLLFCENAAYVSLLAYNFTGKIDNVSLKKVLGNHMLQSTSAARPLMSARVNLLTYTEDFSNYWSVDTAVLSASAVTPPDIATTAVKYTKNAGGGFASVYRYYNTTGNYNWSLVAKSAGWQYLALYLQNPDRFCYFDLINGVLGTIAAGCVATIEDLGDGWFRCSVSHTANGTNAPAFFATPTDNVYAPTGDGVSGIYTTAAQYQIGTQATPYQAILTDGLSYPSTGFPIAQKYDGVDDGMATAAFTAGTLTSGMDCMIPVRRDSVASCVAGLYNGVADATKFFGMAESASGSGCVGSGAGTPTVWVDNTQLTGGTAVTRGTLHTALTGGDWHILEFRNLDLSTWTAAGFGLYTSYLFPGPRGDILLYPSTASTEDKDAARQWLADYYGVTLP